MFIHSTVCKHYTPSCSDYTSSIPFCGYILHGFEHEQAHLQTDSTQSRLEIPCAYSDRVLESGPCKSHSGGCLAACLNLDSTPSPVLLVRNAIPAFNFLYTSDTEHPKPHPRSQLSSQPHPHHFICLGHDSRSADVRTGSFDPTSQLLTSKTKQNTEHRDVREPRGCVPLSTLDQIIRRHVHTCFKSLLNPKLANSVYLYQIRLGATMHLPPEQDSSTVDYPKRG